MYSMVRSIVMLVTAKWNALDVGVLLLSLIISWAQASLESFSGRPLAIRTLIGPEHPGIPGKCIGSANASQAESTIRLGHCGAATTSNGTKLGDSNNVFTLSSDPHWPETYSIVSSAGLCVNARLFLLEPCSPSTVDHAFLVAIAMWTSNGTFPIVSLRSVSSGLQWQALPNGTIAAGPCSNSSLSQLFQLGSPVISTIPASSYSAPGGLVCYGSDRFVVLHWTAPVPLQGNTRARYSVFRRLSGSSSTFTSVIGSITDAYGLHFVDRNAIVGQSYDYQIGSGSWTGPICTASAQVDALNDDDAFLEYLQRTAFDYFWFQANPFNGLVRDRTESWSPASIAAVGFALSAMTVGIDHGYITRKDAASRVLITLTTFLHGPQSNATSKVIGYNGFFYHYLDMTTGYRTWTCELSPIDTALLMSGVLHARQYFDHPGEQQIRGAATSLINAVNWPFMFIDRDQRLALSWTPEPGTGYSPYQWEGLSEGKLMAMMAVGSLTHPIPTSAWSAFTSTYQVTNSYGYAFVQFSPLFGHQYSELFFDYRGVSDVEPSSTWKSVNYFENSRRATLAQQRYSMAKKSSLPWYSQDLWGLTACDGPGNATTPQYYGYTARGANPTMSDDNTFAPTATGGSFMFTPTISLNALRYMYNTYCDLTCGAYGLQDAFNPAWSGTWSSPDALGIDQGPILLSIENQRTAGRIWDTFMENPEMKAASERIPSLSKSDEMDFNLYLASVRPGRKHPLRSVSATYLTSTRHCLTRSAGSSSLAFSACTSYSATATVDSLLLTGGPLQQVDIRQWGSDYYMLQIGPDFDQCVNIPGASKSPGVTLNMWACDMVGYPSGSQWFRVQVVGTDQDSVPIINLVQYNTGYCLEVSGSGTIVQQTCVENRSQQMFVWGSTTVAWEWDSCPSLSPISLTTTTTAVVRRKSTTVKRKGLPFRTSTSRKTRSASLFRHGRSSSNPATTLLPQTKITSRRISFISSPRLTKAGAATIRKQPSVASGRHQPESSLRNLVHPKSEHAQATLAPASSSSRYQSLSSHDQLRSSKLPEPAAESFATSSDRPTPIDVFQPSRKHPSQITVLLRSTSVLASPTPLTKRPAPASTSDSWYSTLVSGSMSSLTTTLVLVLTGVITTVLIVRRCRRLVPPGNRTLALETNFISISEILK